VHDATGAQLEDEEGEDGAQEQVGELQEVARPDVRGVVAQERRPRLPGPTRRPGSVHVLLDGALADPDAELQQLALDALGTPQPVLAGHPADERDRLRRGARRAAGPSGPPPPQPPEAVPVPAEQRLGLDDQQGLTPRPDAAGQQDKQRSIRAGGARTLRRAGEDDELVTKERVLGDQLGPAPDQVRGRAEEQGVGGLSPAWSSAAGDSGGRPPRCGRGNGLDREDE
jgi:hypothetical protein